MPFSNENQTLFIEKLSKYLGFSSKKSPTMYINNDVAVLLDNLKRGLCSGMVALWFYYKHTNKELYFYNSIMNPILTWDNHRKTLSKELEDTMEYALSASVSLQGEIISSMTAYTDTPFEYSMVQQTDYEILIGLLKEDEYPNLRKEYEIAFVFKNKELQSLLDEFLPGKLISLASSDHAIGLFFDGQAYVLFDSNGFIDEQTKERFFEKRFASNDLKNLIKNIQSAFYTPPDSNVIGLTISVFDDVDKPMPIYSDRVKKIRNILYNRISRRGDMDLNASSPYDSASALWFCASRGHLDVVKLLLSRGATYQITKDLVGPIHMAAQNSHFDVLELLLDSSIGLQFIDAPTKSGYSPLYLAAQKGHIEIIKLLLNKGAKIEASIVHLAAQQGYSDVLELLLNAQPQLIDIPMESGLTSLYLASMEGRTETVKLLLARGARVDIRAKNSSNAMHVVAQKGYSAVLELLLNAQPQLIDIPMENGVTALDLASMEGRTEVVKLLLARGARVDIKTNDLLNVIQIAALKGYSAVLELLLDSDIGSQLIDVATESGITALYLASMAGNTEVVKLLLAREAKVDIKTKDSSNAIHIAAQEGYSDVLELLLNAQPQLIDIATESGGTALYLASMAGKVEAVKLLLSRGARIDTNNINLANAIHIAAKNGYCAVLELLLDANRESNLIDAPIRTGATPLYLAAMNGNIDVVELLLSRGAKVNIANTLNPMDIALKNGHSAILLMLKNAKRKQLKDVQTTIVSATNIPMSRLKISKESATIDVVDDTDKPRLKYKKTKRAGRLKN